MRSILTTGVALFVSLTAAAALPAQVKQEEIKPKEKGTTSRMETYYGKKLPEWIKQIKDSDPSLVEDAVRALHNAFELDLL